ncbi:MAG: ABC transporter permease subunit [Pseudomonadota bacterium]
MSVLFLYVAIFVAAFVLYRLLAKVFSLGLQKGLNKLKTVTFGDESTVRANRFASVLSVITIFLIWGAFTGSKLVPFAVPGPFLGDTSFEYTSENAQGQKATSTVFARVHPLNAEAQMPETSGAAASGFAQPDALTVPVRRQRLIKAQSNDGENARVIAVAGQPIAPGDRIDVDNGQVGMSPRGTLIFIPDPGMQMEAIWLPPPEQVWSQFVNILTEKYQGFTLIEQTGWSLMRVVAGFLAGTIIGIPLGYAMGLSDWFRGWFDPIVEFMRPVPPLALIPLFIIWFGIGELSKIGLLFLAALWIMAIAARSGVSGVAIPKVHAAYSLGASKPQILSRVIIPNSLPEIFIGARVAMGVCWGTVVAAELVAAEKGIGKMITVASKFQRTDIMIIGIIVIGVIGFMIEVGMRMMENRLIPWKGRV